MKEMSFCAGQSEALTSHPTNPDLQVGEIGVTRFVASRDKMRGSFAALEDDGEKQATTNAKACGFAIVLSHSSRQKLRDEWGNRLLG